MQQNGLECLEASPNCLLLHTSKFIQELSNQSQNCSKINTASIIQDKVKQLSNIVQYYTNCKCKYQYFISTFRKSSTFWLNKYFLLNWEQASRSQHLKFDVIPIDIFNNSHNSHNKPFMRRTLYGGHVSTVDIIFSSQFTLTPRSDSLYSKYSQ